jgi:hypothetical protein
MASGVNLPLKTSLFKNGIVRSVTQIMMIKKVRLEA